MKEKRYIHRWMLAPVLACLLLATASCSKDATETEAVPSPGGTYLTIVTRGINTTESSEYEDYVGSLRVIAFKGEELALNTLLSADEIPDTEGTVDEVILENTDKLKVGNGGGAYTFYFIANEEGHVTDKDIALDVAFNNITETDLKNMRVKFTQEETGIPKDKKMLMSVKQTVYITEGQNQTIEIELVRALAKAQLVIQSEEEITAADINVSLPADQIPNSYYLIQREPIEESSSFLTSGKTLESTGDNPFDATAVSSENKYVSQVVYLPERAAADEAGALKYSITIDGESYSAPIADGTEDSPVYTIERNYAYTTIGTYDPAKPATIDLTYTVQPFTEVESEHTFN